MTAPEPLQPPAWWDDVRRNDMVVLAGGKFRPRAIAVDALRLDYIGHGPMRLARGTLHQIWGHWFRVETVDLEEQAVLFQYRGPTGKRRKSTPARAHTTEEACQTSPAQESQT